MARSCLQSAHTSLPSSVLEPRILSAASSPCALLLLSRLAAGHRPSSRSRCHGPPMGRMEHTGAGDPVVVVEPTVPLLRERDKSWHVLGLPSHCLMSRWLGEVPAQPAAIIHGSACIYRCMHGTATPTTSFGLFREFICDQTWPCSFLHLLDFVSTPNVKYWHNANSGIYFLY
jgi:hypothetical protein